MADGSQEPPVDSRHSALKTSFRLGIRSLLTAFSKEDVRKAFPSFTNAEIESLYHMFVQVTKSLHENIEAEFDSICQEAKVGTTLDMIEQVVEEQSLDILSADKTKIEDVRKRMSMAKKDVIHYLTSLLGKAEEKIETMKARIGSLKARQDLSVTTDAVEKLRSWTPHYESHPSS